MPVDVPFAHSTFKARDRSDGYWQRFSDAAWEPATQQVLTERLGPGKTYVDIGAWIGSTVLPAAVMGARVLAFEPDPRALEELRTNLGLNPALAQRVTLIPSALGTGAGTASLTPPGDLGDSESSLVRAARPGVSVAVEVQDIRGWLTEGHFEACDLLKMDVEGGEFALLPLMRSYLQKHKPDIMLSLHTRTPARGASLPVDAARRAVNLAGRARVWSAVRGLYRHWYGLPTTSGTTWTRLGSRESALLMAKRPGYELFLTNRPLG